MGQLHAPRTRDAAGATRLHLLPDGYPHADLALARLLERAEGAANAASVVARAALQPDSGAEWTEIAGVYAMFDGPESPITQTFGLGLFDEAGDAEFERIERFFFDRGAPVHHEVSPLLGIDTLQRLGSRGYRPIEVSTVLVRPTAAPVTSAGAIRVRRIEPDEADVWARIAARGWATEAAHLVPFLEEFGRISARAEGSHCFLAELDDRPVAAAALSLRDDIALLAGASTIPEFRRRGAQLALLEGRLRFATELGATLAMMVALPGSASQRNAERQGFRIAYTRTKWARGLPERSP